MKNIKTLLKDISRIQEVNTKFKDRLKAYLNNPDMLMEDINNLQEQAEIDLAKTTIDEMENVKDIQELKEFLKTLNPKIAEKVIETLPTSDKPELQKLGKDYNELVEGENAMMEIFQKIEVDPVVQSMANIVSDAFNSANNIKEAIQLINDFIITNTLGEDVNTVSESDAFANSVAEGLTQLMQEYE